MKNTPDLLDGPEYFLCEKTRCRLRIAVCIQRQEANKKERLFTETPFMACEDCSQGINNRNLLPKGDVKLSEEIIENRPGQVEVKSEPGQSEESLPVRLCECGKPTISPNSPFCPSCMARKANESKRKNSSRKAKKKHLDGSPGKGTFKLSPTAVIVEFKDHSDILEQITRDARDQIRSVSGQIIWTLKNFASPAEERDSHVQDL